MCGAVSDAGPVTAKSEPAGATATCCPGPYANRVEHEDAVARSASGSCGPASLNTRRWPQRSASRAIPARATSGTPAGSAVLDRCGRPIAAAAVPAARTASTSELSMASAPGSAGAPVADRLRTTRAASSRARRRVPPRSPRPVPTSMPGRLPPWKSEPPVATRPAGRPRPPVALVAGAGTPCSSTRPRRSRWI